jgi:hypothetical protein
VGAGPIRAINSDNPGAMYIAAGSRFYRVGVIAGSPEDLGEIGTPTSSFARDTLTTIAVGPTQAVVCVPPNAFTCDHNGPLNQITGTFPGASSVAYLDGYFVFTAVWTLLAGGAKFFVSYLLDPTMYAALDFAFADGVPNVLRRVIAHRGELWFLGEAGIEIWYNAGAQDFAFRRQSGGVIATGSATPKAVAQGDGSVFWLGMADDVVYRSEGYRASRISTNAIEAIIAAAGGASTAEDGFVYSQNGHTFYCLTLGGRTLVYDCATKLWHDRSSGADGTGRWRPNSAAWFGVGNVAALGDSASGKVFVPDLTVGTEERLTVPRQVTFPPLWGGTHRAFCSRLEIEMETPGGHVSAGRLKLEWSDDGGRTFTGERWLNTGTPVRPSPDLRLRVATTRLGSYRQRVYRITTWGQGALYAVDADIVGGTD